MRLFGQGIWLRSYWLCSVALGLQQGVFHFGKGGCPWLDRVLRFGE